MAAKKKRKTSVKTSANSLNSGGASLTSQYENRAANSLANGFASYDVTQDNNKGHCYRNP